MQDLNHINEEVQQTTPLNLNMTDAGQSESPYELSWWAKLIKFRQQSNSIAGALLYFLATGLHIAWGIWRLFMNWPFEVTENKLIFVISSFYVAAIVGSVMTPILLIYYSKRNIYNISGTIMFIGNLIFLASATDLYGVSFGRFFVGLSYGIAYITYVIHAGEIAEQSIRGHLLSLGNFMLVTSMFFAIIIYTIGVNIQLALSYDRIIGIIGIGFSAIGLFLTSFLTVESVPNLIVRVREHEALQTLIKLRGEEEETIQIRFDFDELKIMCVEDLQQSRSIFREGNLRPLLLMIAIRTQYLLTHSFPINMIMLFYAYKWIGTFAPLICITSRWVFALVPTFLVDHSGRKRLFTLSSEVGGVVLLLFGCLRAIYDVNERYWYFIIFFIAFQIAVSFGIDPISNVYIGEAFPMTKKAWSTAFVVIIENLLHFLLIIILVKTAMLRNFTGLIIFLFIDSILILIIGVLVGEFYLPETKGLTIRETRNLFCGRNYRLANQI